MYHDILARWHPLGGSQSFSSYDWLHPWSPSLVLFSCWSSILFYPWHGRWVGIWLEHYCFLTAHIWKQAPGGTSPVSMFYSRVKGVAFSWRIKRAVQCYFFFSPSNIAFLISLSTMEATKQHGTPVDYKQAAWFLYVRIFFGICHFPTTEKTGPSFLLSMPSFRREA